MERFALRRLLMVLLLTFVIVFLSNTTAFNPLGSLRAWFIEATLFFITLAGVWKAGIFSTLQVRSRQAAIEILIILAVLVVYLAFNGTRCQLPTLCISTDDSWGVVGLGTFLVAVGSNLFVGITEETLFRGYLMHEITDNLRIKGLKGGSFPVQAIGVSAVLFALWHVPHYGSSATGILLLGDLTEPLVAGLFFGLVYWWTDWNLAVPILSHFSFDAFGSVGPLGSPRSFVVPLTLVGFPMIAVAFHIISRRGKTREKTKPKLDSDLEDTDKTGRRFPVIGSREMVK